MARSKVPYLSKRIQSYPDSDVGAADPSNRGKASPSTCRKAESIGIGSRRVREKGIQPIGPDRLEAGVVVGPGRPDIKAL